MYSEKHCLQNASMVTFQETTASHKVIYFTKKSNTMFADAKGNTTREMYSYCQTALDLGKSAKR
jgi:hypothetical protein